MTKHLTAAQLAKQAAVLLPPDKLEQIAACQLADLRQYARRRSYLVGIRAGVDQKIARLDQIRADVDQEIPALDEQIAALHERMLAFRETIASQPGTSPNSRIGDYQ